MGFNARAQKVATLGPFLGVDNTSTPETVGPQHAVDSLNILPDRLYGAYVTARGRVPMLSKIGQFIGADLPAANGNIFKFDHTNENRATYLMLGIDQNIWYFSRTQVPTLLTSGGGNSAGVGVFGAYSKWAFFNGGGVATGSPILIDMTNFSSMNWGITAPTNAPLAQTVITPGNLVGDYQYVYTYENSNENIESGPSQISNVAVAVAATQGQIQLFNIQPSSDPQVTTINIYRTGGTLADFMFVGSISNTGGGPFTYIDDLADLSVTGQNLVTSRDPAVPFNSIVVYQDRVFGIGPNNGTNPERQSDVWYSNYAEPWAFDNVNQVIPLNRNRSGDVCVGGAVVGGYLVVLKTRSAFAIYGDDASNFTPQPLFNVGCVGVNTIQSAYGLMFWLSDQGVWQFDGSNLQNISDGLNQSGSSIKGALDSYAITDLEAATGAFYDRFYLLSFPTIGVTWAYFIPTQQWYKLGFFTYSWCYDLDNNNEVTAVQQLTPGPPSALITEIDSWFAAENDLGNPISSYYTSGQMGLDSTEFWKQYSHVEITAPFQNSSSVTATVTVDPGSAFARVFTYTWNLQAGFGPTRKLISMPPTMQGSMVQLQLSATTTEETSVSSMSVYAYPKRRMVQQGSS